MKHLNDRMLGACLALIFAPTALASTLTWDAGAADGLWTSADNWDPNALPVAGDTVAITNGGTIDTVGLASGLLPGNLNITLSGNTTLTQSGSVIRLSGAKIDVGSSSALAGSFWDLNNGTLTFHDGASASMANWEQKGTNVINFILGPTGFSPLTPGTLRFGTGTTIADATYTVDMANYTGGSATITLIDFNTDVSGMNDTVFQGAGGLNILNHGNYTASLHFNDALDAIQLVVVRPVVWNGGGGDGKWTTASNWEANTVPVTGEIVQISNGGTIDTVDLASGLLPASLNITLSGNTTLTQTGSVIRLQGADINVGSGSALAGNFWDLNNGTLTFHDGASATMANWEQKGTNVFNFILGPTGFSPLTPGTLRFGTGTTIANATYTVDMATYTGGTGVITLMDFTTDAASMDNDTFQGAGGLNILNAGPYTADLRWNNTTEAIELHITEGPSTTLPSIIGITRDGGGNVILTLDGPASGLAVQQSDDLAGFADIASTPSDNTLTIDAADTDPDNDGTDFYRVRNN